MLVERLGAAAVSTAAAPALAAVTALGFESEPLRRHAARRSAGRAARDPFLIEQAGPGAARAAAAAAAALERGAAGLLAWGVAGALSRKLAPGMVIIPRLILGPDGVRYEPSAEWRAALVRALGADFDVDDGVLFSSAAVIGTPAEKARAAEETGAHAVDMESAGIARVAAAATVPFIAVRVIVDAADDALPSHAERWVDAAGNRRWTAALESALRPGEWCLLWRLAQRYRRATLVLHGLAGVLVPVQFGWPGTR